MLWRYGVWGSTAWGGASGDGAGKETLVWKTDSGADLIPSGAVHRVLYTLFFCTRFEEQK